MDQKRKEAALLVYGELTKHEGMTKELIIERLKGDSEKYTDEEQTELLAELYPEEGSGTTGSASISAAGNTNAEKTNLGSEEEKSKGSTGSASPASDSVKKEVDEGKIVVNLTEDVVVDIQTDLLMFGIVLGGIKNDAYTGKAKKAGEKLTDAGNVLATILAEFGNTGELKAKGQPLFDARHGDRDKISSLVGMLRYTNSKLPANVTEKFSEKVTAVKVLIEEAAVIL